MFIEAIKPIAPMEFSAEAKTWTETPRGQSFGNVLDNAIAALSDTQETSRLDAYRLSLGNVDNVGEVMINTLKAETMIQTAVQITARAVSAYKEIMNIQI